MFIESPSKNLKQLFGFIIKAKSTKNIFVQVEQSQWTEFTETMITKCSLINNKFFDTRTWSNICKSIHKFEA